MGRNDEQREFDRYAADYGDILNESVALSGYDASYFDEYKIREMLRVVRRMKKPATSLTILNFGCGVGRSERLLDRYFPSSTIYSTDVSPESIRAARERNGSMPNVTFAVCDESTIPFNVSCDIILCAGVLHHVSPEKRESILLRLRGKLAPGGQLFIFEHNPWNPLTRRVVASCPFDANADLLPSSQMTQLLRQAGFRHVFRRFIVFFPRALGQLAPLERLLGWCPLGAQYYMVASN